MTDTIDLARRRLRNALIANAVLSASSAAAGILFATAIARWTGLEPSLVRGLGLELAAFAAGVGFVATRPDLGRPGPRRAAIFIVALDVAWVLASAAFLLRPNPLTPLGVAMVIAVALAVAELAWFQASGLRRIRGAQPAARAARSIGTNKARNSSASTVATPKTVA